LHYPIERDWQHKHAAGGVARIIARQSTWQVRVNHDGKGSRGIRIMPLMIVAGKG
jgi:hypothetical protein